MATTDVDHQFASEGPALEGLLDQVGQGGRAIVGAATRALVARFGDRGSCVLTNDRARVVLSTEDPTLIELAIDPARTPEITAAVASRAVVVIDDGSIVVVPLVVGARCLGVIRVESDRPKIPSPTDVAAAQVEGRLVATLLDLQFGPGLDDELNRRIPPAAGTLNPALVVDIPDDAESPGIAAGGVKRRILVAEDDTDQATMIEKFLTGEGFEVALTRNGVELLKQAYRVRPDLILLDGHMPILSGFDAAERLGRDIRTSNIPVVFLSGARDLLLRVRNLKADTIDFMRKPYSPLELLARIERALNQGRSREHLRVEANIDALTGLGNARCLRQSLSVERSRMARYGATAAIVMMDVDKLKDINDRHGHLVGSRVLQAIGELLQTTVRDTDLAARYGGDEFVVMLSNLTAVEGGAFAERLLGRVRELRPQGIEVSMSMGIAPLGAEGDTSMDVFLAQADAAAYRAKRLGGNRSCVYDSALDLDMPPGRARAGERSLLG